MSTKDIFQNNKTRWLDLWTKNVLGLEPGKELTRELIEKHQLQKLNELFAYTRKNSSFYAGLYSEFAEDFKFGSVKDIEKLPFTTPADLQKYGEDLLCVNPKEISRIVTLATSGTTGAPKQIYYTPYDQRLTIDHFKFGMQYLIDKDGKVLILLPHERSGSVGDLLAEGVKELGAEVTFDFEDTGITCIVGLPSHLASLAKASSASPRKDGHPVSHAYEIKETLNSVLLTAEYVSQENIKIITDAWDCLPFEHYGMTEMGLGGAVTCNKLCGYHPREHDLLFEIIDPVSGKTMPDGQYGEVVFTTLTRQGMPFIRYRTGDISRFIPEPCPCGSVLKRLARVGDREFSKGYDPKKL